MRDDLRSTADGLGHHETDADNPTRNVGASQLPPIRLLIGAGRGGAIRKTGSPTGQAGERGAD